MGIIVLKDAQWIVLSLRLIRLTVPVSFEESRRMTTYSSTVQYLDIELPYPSYSSGVTTSW